MTDASIKISQLVVANTTNKSLPTDTNALWFVALDSTKNKTFRVNMEELFGYLSEVGKISNSVTVTPTDGITIKTDTGKDTQTITAGSSYFISDNTTFNTAKSAYTTANSAYITANSAYKKANLAYDLAGAANFNANQAKATATAAKIISISSENLSNTAINTANDALIKINNHIIRESVFTANDGTEHPVVTTTANGFMSIGDKNNLDTIVSNGLGKIIIHTGDGLRGGIGSSNVFTLLANSASTTANGVVTLNDTLLSNSITQAATANVANTLNTLLNNLPNKVDLSSKVTITTGNGLSGGKSDANVFLLTANTASITNAGVVKLNDTLNSSSISEAATANTVYNLNKMLQPNTRFKDPTNPTSVTGAWDIGDTCIRWGTTMIEADNIQTNITLEQPYPNSYSTIIVAPQWSWKDSAGTLQDAPLLHPLKATGMGGIGQANTTNPNHSISDGMFTITKHSEDSAKGVRVSWFFIGSFTSPPSSV